MNKGECSVPFEMLNPQSVMRTSSSPVTTHSLTLGTTSAIKKFVILTQPMSRRSWSPKLNAGRHLESTSSSSYAPPPSVWASKVAPKRRERPIVYDTTFIPDGALISAAELNSNLTRLSRLSAGIDSGLVGKYIKRALALAGTNEIGCKEFVNFIHSLSRLNSGAFEGIDISPLMQELKAKLKNNRRFKLKMTSVDVAVCLNSITRLKDLSCEVGSLSTQIACALGDEIPCRISQFEDHHLAIILHCYSKFDIKDTVVIEEVLSEIELSRTLTNFTLQSTIMIAVACSRLAIHTLLVKNREDRKSVV